MVERHHSKSAADPDALLRLAAGLQRDGRRKEALTATRELLELSPGNAKGWNLLGNLQLESGAIAEALASYERALSLNGTYMVARHNRAVALMQNGRPAEAEQEFARLTAQKPDDANALMSLGICFAAQGKHGEAVSVFDQALALGAGSAALHRTRAESLRNLERPAEALAGYDRAIAGSDNAESRIGRGMLLLSLQRDSEALPDFDRALMYSRAAADGWLGRGIALFRLQRLQEADAAFAECLRLRPRDKNALYNRANALLTLKDYDGAARAAEALLQLDPEYAYAAGLLLHARLYACDWRDYHGLCENAANAIKAGRPAIHPFLNLAISDVPALNLRAAEIFAQDLHGPASPPGRCDVLYRHERIRIAYLSADFYEHATAFLMAGVFEQHDRTRFETIAMSYGPNDHSQMRHRLESALDHFIDVRSLPDRAVAEKLRDMEVDIAIDLKGYTGDARPGILTHRPAPIQVHYLGYPGSLGTRMIDYLIADEIVIPPEAMKDYAEQVVHLPGCYQCNDSRRPDPEISPSRGELGLPEEAFVFCCFNSSFKIAPETFAIWMRLLREVPDGVLWLLKSNPAAVANLGREAARHGIAPQRLIFAEPVPLQQHLARLRLADLALDTFPYGAHTTASDAVWAGVPLLTRRGTSFASRVAASILTSAGLSDLVTGSADDYLDRAVALARNRESLSAIRRGLREKRAALPLFDTVLFTRRLESAYTMMYERHQSGLAPAHFRVPA